MSQTFCTRCGNALTGSAAFCSRCGAPIKTVSTGSPAPQTPPATQVMARQQQVQTAPYAPPAPPSAAARQAGGAPAAMKVLLSALSVLLAAGIGLCIWRVAGGPSGKGVSGYSGMKSGAYAQSGASTLLLPPAGITVDDYVLEDPPPDALQGDGESVNGDTGAASSTFLPLGRLAGYDELVMGLSSPGITEQEAVALFGDPISREDYGYDEETYLLLDYGAFRLFFPMLDGETSPCVEAEVTDVSSRVWVYDLTIGMDRETVDFALLGSPFSLVYEGEAGSYLVYEEESTGRYLDICFKNGAVSDFLVFYSP